MRKGTPEEIALATKFYTVISELINIRLELDKLPPNKTYNIIPELNTLMEKICNKVIKG